VEALFPVTALFENDNVEPLPIASSRSAESAAPAMLLFWTVTLTVAPPTGCACTCVPLSTYGQASLNSFPRAT
jgi:hypothetical protein